MFEKVPAEAPQPLPTGLSRGRPSGEAAWARPTAQRLGLVFTRRNPGRPARRKTNECTPLSPCLWRLVSPRYSDFSMPPPEPGLRRSTNEPGLT